MGASLAPWLFAAAYFPALQVAPLYLFHRVPRARAIYRRMAVSCLAAAAAGWLPTALRLADRGGSSAEVRRLVGAGLDLVSAMHWSRCELSSMAQTACSTPQLWLPTHPLTNQQVLEALGLRTAGLAPACVLPLALTALLFAGPLLALAWGASAQPRLPPAQRLRNWLAAPLAEEFVFRSCMLSYLLASGARPAAAAALSPLLFGAAHLHHAHDLVRHQGVAPAAAARAVAFQLCYTTPFGWLAAFYFLRTRHLAAAALPHAFCNFIGPPAPPPSNWGRGRRRALAAAYAAGILAFACLLLPLTEPQLYANI